MEIVSQVFRERHELDKKRCPKATLGKRKEEEMREFRTAERGEKQSDPRQPSFAGYHGAPLRGIGLFGGNNNTPRNEEKESNGEEEKGERFGRIQ